MRWEIGRPLPAIETTLLKRANALNRLTSNPKSSHTKGGFLPAATQVHRQLSLSRDLESHSLIFVDADHCELVQAHSHLPSAFATEPK
jgi:hypothetical protein